MSLKKPISDAPDSRGTYQFSDLKNWEFTGTALAVIGFPVEHSISPQMHNAALQCMAQTQITFADWRYFKFAIHPDDVSAALNLMHEKKFRGVNLTIPHKVDVVNRLTYLDTVAQQMGAVNTLCNERDTGFTGYNTDGWGMATAIERTLGVELAGSTVIVLGAGGAARAAAIQCLHSGCAELWVGNRNQDRLQGLLHILQPLVHSGQQLTGFDLARLPAGLSRKAIVINATALGLQPDDPTPIDLSKMDAGCRVYDMIYNRVTPLIAQAQKLGMPHADGLSMLVWQGVRALEIWSGAAVPAQVMMTAACNAMKIKSRDV